MGMIAFHGDEKIKHKYLRRVRGHMAKDQLVKGQYWQDGRGCGVGCTIHGSDHAKYETELGIPFGLAVLEDDLFEKLPNELAMTWPDRFLSAIEPGADLSTVGSEAEAIQSALDHLKAQADFVTKDDEEGDRYWASGINTAITAMRDHLKRVTPPPATAQGWVACSAQLPEDGKLVLVFRELAPWQIGSPVYVDWYQTGKGFHRDKTVTHWMPLPTPPEHKP